MQRQDLIQAIEYVKPGLSNTVSVEMSDNLIFTEDFITTFNGEVAVSHPFRTGLRAGVKADEFIKLLKKINSEEISLATSEDEIILEGGSTEAGFKFLPGVEWPDTGIGGIKDGDWKDLPKDLPDALKFCKFSVSTDISQGLLTCLRAEKGEMISCDRYRLTLYRMKGRMEETYIPGNVVDDLIKHSPTHMTKAGEWVHFINKFGTIFTIRPLLGEYPPVKQLFDVEGEEAELPGKPLKEMMGRAGIMAINNTVRIVIEPGKIICDGSNEQGWVKETMKTDYKGRLILFNINSKFLTEILEHSNKVIIGETALLFNGPQFQHVVCRSKDPE